MAPGRCNRSKNPEELYSKHLVYIDSEADAVVYRDMYDRRGELMVNFCNWLTYRDRPLPDAKVVIYSFRRVFQANATGTDVRNDMSSFCDLPTPGASKRECWRINTGRVDTADFTADATVNAALGFEPVSLFPLFGKAHIYSQDARFRFSVERRVNLIVPSAPPKGRFHVSRRV